MRNSRQARLPSRESVLVAAITAALTLGSWTSVARAERCITCLIPGYRIVGTPAWSADASKIAVTVFGGSDCHADPAAIFAPTCDLYTQNIWVSDLLGKNPNPITNYPSIVRSDPSGLEAFNRNGTSGQRVSPSSRGPTGAPPFSRSCRWS